MVKSCEDILITQKMHNLLQKECKEKVISLKSKQIERNNMLPLAGMLFNVVSGLVMDKAQSLAKEHVEKMIDDVLPEEAKHELNEIVKNDPEHPFESATDALVAAAEKKLPIPMKDGKLLPIEQDFTIRFDPNTRKVEVVQQS
tara:strand:+ start:2459 stop:2887 length:429 start_codon:yes stop_codon:yes gene_type:complete